MDRILGKGSECVALWVDCRMSANEKEFEECEVRNLLAA